MGDDKASNTSAVPKTSSENGTEDDEGLITRKYLNKTIQAALKDQYKQISTLFTTKFNKAIEDLVNQVKTIRTDLDLVKDRVDKLIA